MRTKTLLGIVASLLLAPWISDAVPAPSVLPDTPLGSLTREWLKLCRQPDAAALTQYAKNYGAPDILKQFPAEKIAAGYVHFCSDNGELIPVQVLSSNERHLQIKVYARRSESWFLLDRGLDEAGHLNEAHSRPTLPPEDRLPHDLSDAALARQLRSSADRLAKLGLFSGIVTVAREGKIIASASAGFANRERHTPITTGSQFTLGSMGKMFTAVAAGQLVDAGKLSFNDTVGKTFSDYPNAIVKNQVTVSMLLSHTGGLKDFLGKRPPKMMSEGVQRASEFVPLFAEDALEFPPGSSWSYSNAGVALAGAIVEAVSGEPYPEYLRRHVFSPAGMKDSDPNNSPRTFTSLVTPYTREAELGNPSSDWQEAEHDIGSPAGGAVSSTDDLIRFSEALLSGKLVSRSTLATLTTPQERSPSEYPYALGFEIEDVYGQKVFGHTGGFPGVSTQMGMLEAGHYTFVVLTNEDFASAYISQIALAWVAEKSKRHL